jgi:hypothetical protein
MRSFALLCITCSIALADAQKVPFVDVINASTVGDWAAYEGQRREGDKLVPHRVFVQVRPKIDGNVRLVWFHGEKGKETRLHGKTIAGRPNPIDQIADIAATMTKSRADVIKDITLETGTCKLAKDVPCTIVRFTLDGHEVIVGMSTVVRAMGIASLEIKHPTKGVMWKLRATGYGRDKQPEWGTVLPADLTDPSDGTVVSVSKRVPTAALTIGEPQTSGGELDKAIIRRYIKRNAQKLGYCYEKTLLVKPGIVGTIAAKFEIAVDGTVSTSTAVGVDPDVSSCVAGVIKNIEFPKPKNAAVVQVAYSFTFKPSN